jgi:cytochrome c553
MTRPLGLACIVAALLGAAAAVAQAPDGLRGPEAFAGIQESRERSIALFTEAGKVLQHPRCVNCHPADDRPRQGMQSRLHQPAARRGPDNHGVAGMTCNACHHATNFDAARVPGHPDWHLAPLSMAWLGRSLGQICTQLKDGERNGGKTMDEIAHHMAEDSLVGWAWAPGAGREPAPGTQRQLGALIRGWIDTGAECPGE